MGHAAPRQGQADLMLPGDRHVVQAGVGGPFRVLVLLQVVRLGQAGVDQDGPGGGDGRRALPEDQDVQRVDAGLLQAQLGGDLAGGVHLGDARRQQQALGRHPLAVLLVADDQPVLLPRGVQVVAAGIDAGLDDLAAVLGERADGVEDDLRAVKELGQGLDVVRDLDDLVLDGVDARNLVHGLLDPGLVPAGRGERDVVLAQVLADHAAGVTGGAVDDDGLAHGWCPLRVAYMPMPPSTGSPAPVMKRAASEARKTTASAMSATSPRRPCGVSPTTAPMASGTLGNRPSATTSWASWLPISVGHSPG